MGMIKQDFKGDTDDNVSDQEMMDLSHISWKKSSVNVIEASKDISESNIHYFVKYILEHELNVTQNRKDKLKHSGTSNFD